MPQWLTFRRTSGRDLKAVRRAKPTYSKSALAAMRKADLVAAAEQAGVDVEGTKADLVERLAPQQNDADVTTTDG